MLTALAVTLIVLVVAAEAALVETVNVAVLDPAGTVTLASTVAAVVLLEDKVTLVPPAGAAAFRTTVAVDELPRFTVVGLSVNDTGAAVGVICSTAFCVTAPMVPPMFTENTAVTAFVVIGNVAVVAPCGTTTTVETFALTELLVSDTDAPPAGAGSLSVTVPVTPIPPTTDAGSTVTDVNVTGWVTGVIVNETLSTILPSVARMDATVTVGTVVAATVNVPDVSPCRMVTVGWTIADADVDAKAIVNPPTGAGLVIVTVAVTQPPPFTCI